MSKKRETIVEITKKLRCMDFNSVVVMKTAADILAAKERLDRESAEERKSKSHSIARSFSSSRRRSRIIRNERCC